MYPFGATRRPRTGSTSVEDHCARHYPLSARPAWQGNRMTEGRTEDRAPERTVFGHPIGLVNLFGVELWERFSFYGMLTILGYYLY